MSNDGNFRFISVTEDITRSVSVDYMNKTYEGTYIEDGAYIRASIVLGGDAHSPTRIIGANGARETATQLIFDTVRMHVPPSAA